jgi:hypothetical protein
MAGQHPYRLPCTNSPPVPRAHVALPKGGNITGVTRNPSTPSSEVHAIPGPVATVSGQLRSLDISRRAQYVDHVVGMPVG